MRIGILGGGNMGEALLAGLLKERLTTAQKILVGELDRAKQKRLRKTYGVRVTSDNHSIVRRSDIVILAVKPQKMEELFSEIGPLSGKPLVISIAAGIRISFIQKHLGKVPVIRVMPNLAAAVGEAISAMAAGRFTASRHRRMAETIFSSVGETVWVPESQLDAVTAVSGSGPAYVASFMKALAQGAEGIGLSPTLSRRLVNKTFWGSLMYLSQKGIDPEAFIGQVASKGGTTEAALSVFRSRGLSRTIALALKKASERSRKLSRG